MSDLQSQFINYCTKHGMEPHPSAMAKDCPGGEYLKDSRGKKTLKYKLIIDGDIAWGWMRSYRTGDYVSWFSRAPKDWTDAQRAEWVTRRKEIEAQAQAELKETQERVAAECKARWLSLPPCESHPYLKRKGVKIEGPLRVDGDLLVIPALDETGKIWTLQTIGPDGFKLFTEDGRKAGCFWPIGIKKADTPDLIYVCEGVATALTIREATGCPVIAAFDKGGLQPVSMAVKRTWPGAYIVFAADNDQWTIKTPRPAALQDINAHDIPGDDARWDAWRDKGWLCNPGIEAAQASAAKIGGTHVLWPEFEACDIIKKPTDWNDAASLYGLESVTDRLRVTAPSTLTVAQAPPVDMVEQAPPPLMLPATGDEIIGDWQPDYDLVIEQHDTPAPVKTRKDGNPEWFNEFIWDKEPSDKLGSMLSIKNLHDGKSLANTIIFIRNYWPGMFVLNEFSDELLVRHCPPWDNRATFRVHRITDVDINELTAALEHYGFNPQTERTFKALVTVAEKDKIHPVREYFNDLQWDGVPRLETWLRDYAGARTQPENYLSRIGTMWIVAGAARIFEPGIKFDHMLVLEGPQNIGKSTLLRELATFGDIRESYFSDGITMAELDRPHALQIIQGKLILEFAELDGMDKAGDAQLKRWITKQEDDIVKKYEKFVTHYPRQFILAGTTNDDTWLRDSTGNRRYWPVKCANTDLQGLKEIKEQLWAEAVHLYKNGYKIYLSDNDPVYGQARAEQALRVMGDSWADIIEPMLERSPFLRYQDLYEFLGVPIKERDATKDARIRGVMRNFGWEYKQAFSLTRTKQNVWLKK